MCHSGLHACSGDRQPGPRGPSLTFLLYSSFPSSDLDPAWRALCFLRPAGLLYSYGPLHSTTAMKYSFTTQNHAISICSRRQLHQIEHVSQVGPCECSPLCAARPLKSETVLQLPFCPLKENRTLLWDGSEARLHGFWKANIIIWLEVLWETNFKPFFPFPFFQR